MDWKVKFPESDIYLKGNNALLYCDDCVNKLSQFPDECIDLVVTSPPYDSLRTYNQKNIEDVWNFEVFKKVAKELYRVIKKGGVVVWVVNDATIKGSETGTSFRQALYFRDECGFNLYDTMIYAKNNYVPLTHRRYEQQFEYMFIFSKGKPKTFNPIKDRKNKFVGKKKSGTIRQKDGSMKKKSSLGKTYGKYGIRYNVWQLNPQSVKGHPAPFPEQLAHDHIISWSNPGDVVLDIFAGSGTTLKMGLLTNRKVIGIEINKEYCDIIKQRIQNVSLLK